MADSNLYVLEVRYGVLLYLNQRVRIRDGWWWGSDETCERGPFASSELALEDARRHSDKKLNLIVWNRDNIRTVDEPSPSGNLIVIDTRGWIWAPEGEPPARPKVGERKKNDYAVGETDGREWAADNNESEYEMLKALADIDLRQSDDDVRDLIREAVNSDDGWNESDLLHFLFGVEEAVAWPPEEYCRGFIAGVRKAYRKIRRKL